MLNIEWKPIKDYEDLYMVSNTGLVKSLHWDIIDSRNDPYLFEQEIKQAIINFYEYQKIGNAGGAYRLYKKLLDKGID